MTSLSTTDISTLPNNSDNNSKPIQNSMNNNENIKIDNYGQQLSNERKEMNMAPQIDYSSQLNSVLKEASDSGATVLPSRDIPSNTLSMQHDTNIKQNTIPKNNNDYIGDIITREQIIKENNKKQNYSDNADYFYELLQIPLLISIMYFIFQLPATRKNLLYFLPSLYYQDGNPNLYGYIFNSVIFGLLYLLIQKGANYFTP